MTMLISSLSDFRRAMRHGPYAWPGGYPRYFILSDGETLSFAAARTERRAIIEALARADNRRGGWINWENPDLSCCHTGERIPSAYAVEDDKSEDGA